MSVLFENHSAANVLLAWHDVRAPRVRFIISPVWEV